MDPSLTSNELRRQPPPKAHTKKMKHIIQRPAISRFSSSWIPSLSRRRSTQPHNERNSQPPQHSAANVVAIAQHSVAESIVNIAVYPSDLSTLSTATSNSDDQTYEKSIPSSILHDVNADDLRQTVQRRLSEHISLLLQERTLDAFSSWTAAYPDHVLADERRYTYGETQDEQTPGDKGRSTSMDEDRFPPTPTSYSAPCHFSVATALQDAHLPPTPTSYSPPPHDDAMAIASLSELAGQLTASQYQEWHVQDGSSTSDPPPDTARDEDMALVGPESPEPSSSGGLNQALRSRSTASLPSISPSLSSSPPSSSASPYVRFPSKSSELTQPDGQASVRVGTHKQYRPGLSDLRLIPWTGTSLSIPLVDGGPILPQYHTQSLEKPINEVATVSNSALSGEAASLAPWTGVVSESSAYSIPESQFLPTAPEVADARPRNQV
ncbi:hypothetical protein DXG01_009317 [Tephrocybe rancida]|nr:hypothetical protein DXG01_009317 [Tephrocybe rancida]